jgi:hypothetical protein
MEDSIGISGLYVKDILTLPNVMGRRSAQGQTFRRPLDSGYSTNTNTLTHQIDLPIIAALQGKKLLNSERTLNEKNHIVVLPSVPGDLRLQQE